MNNKGFSLDELIIVIAIMAILAVTLAPRLVQYVERSRVASDKEIAHTVFSAARLADIDDPLPNSAEIKLVEDGIYTVSGKVWTLKDTATFIAGLEETDPVSEEFYTTFLEILSNTELKSTGTEDAEIIVTKTGNDISVTLDFGTNSSEVDYVVK